MDNSLEFTKFEKKITLYERLNIKIENSYKSITDIVVCDVSFISIRKFLHIKNFFKPKFTIISLIKPQFEAKREEVGKGGIIKETKVHNQVCKEIELWFLKKL